MPLFSFLLGNLLCIVLGIVDLLLVEVFEVLLNLGSNNILLVPLVLGLVLLVKLPKLVPVSFLACLVLRQTQFSFLQFHLQS